jgi:hypothetical protein
MSCCNERAIKKSDKLIEDVNKAPLNVPSNGQALRASGAITSLSKSSCSGPRSSGSHSSANQILNQKQQQQWSDVLVNRRHLISRGMGNGRFCNDLLVPCSPFFQSSAVGMPPRQGS